MKYKIKKLSVRSFKNEFIGDPNTTVNYVSNLNNANLECLTFCNSNRINEIENVNAGIILVNQNMKKLINKFGAKALIFSNNPMKDFIEIITLNYSNKLKKKDLSIRGDNLSIAENVFIEEKCLIGDNTEIFPNTVIHSNSKIGKNCRIQSNSTIGAIGLAYVEEDKKFKERFIHLGGVIIEDNVDIGSNTTVVKGILQNTIIGEGTKIGNNVNIGHNVIIGKNCFISAGAMLCGSVVVEDNCWIAPGSNILNKVIVKQNTLIGLGSVVFRNTKSNSVYVGNPAKRINERK